MSQNYKKYQNYKNQSYPITYGMIYQDGKIIVNKPKDKGRGILKKKTLQKFENLEHKLRDYLAEFVKYSDSYKTEKTAKPDSRRSKKNSPGTPLEEQPSKIIMEIKQKTKKIQEYNKMLEKTFKKNQNQEIILDPHLKKIIFNEVKSLEEILKERKQEDQYVDTKNNSHNKQCQTMLQDCIDMLEETIKDETKNEIASSRNRVQKSFSTPINLKKRMAEERHHKMSDDEFFKQYNLEINKENDLDAGEETGEDEREETVENEGEETGEDEGEETVENEEEETVENEEEETVETEGEETVETEGEESGENEGEETVENEGEETGEDECEDFKQDAEYEADEEDDELGQLPNIEGVKFRAFEEFDEYENEAEEDEEFTEPEPVKYFKNDKRKLYQIKDELANLEHSNMTFLNVLHDLKSNLKMKNLEYEEINGYEFAEEVHKMKQVSRDFETSKQNVDKLIGKLKKHTRYTFN